MGLFGRDEIQLGKDDFISLAVVLTRLSANNITGVTEFTCGKFTISVKYIPDARSATGGEYVVTGIRVTGEASEIRRDHEVREADTIGGGGEAGGLGLGRLGKLRTIGSIGAAKSGQYSTPDHRGGYPSKPHSGESRTPKLPKGPASGARSRPAPEEQYTPKDAIAAQAAASRDTWAADNPGSDVPSESSPVTGGVRYTYINQDAVEAPDTDTDDRHPGYRNSLRKNTQ